MYYIQTADRLTRTSVWLEKMEGGIEYLRDVIVNDRLGICDELERQMQYLVDTYQCEWKAVVNDPEKRRLFQQFANTDETEPTIEFVTERGQQRPADWPSDFVPIERAQARRRRGRTRRSGRTGDASGCRSGKVWRLSRRRRRDDQVRQDADRRVPLRQPRRVVRQPEHVPAQARVGAVARHHRRSGTACPRSPARCTRRRFRWNRATCLSGEDYQVQVFPVKVEGDDVYVELPPAEELDELLRAATLVRACLRLSGARMPLHGSS